MNMKKTLIGERGVSLLTAIMLLLLLSVLGLAVVSLVMVDTQVSLNNIAPFQAFYVAEAGIERAIRAIRDDTSTTQTTNPAADGYCVRPCVDGYTTAGASGSNYAYALFYGGTSPGSATDYTVINRYCTLNATAGANVQVYNFQQRYNLMGVPIRTMEIGIRAQKSSTGTSPTMQLRYSTNGGTSWTNVGSAITLSTYDSTWATVPVTFYTISATPTWSNLLDGTSFRIQAYRSAATGVSILIDYLCIRVTLKVDCSTEPWFTTFKNSDGSAKTVNIALGNGVIATMPIDDEAGKVHLNYASQSLLNYLMQECTIPAATASTLATNIVTYRGTNWFDTIEEVKQATGMTTAYYGLIKDYITVYPWVNPNVQKTTGNRAPININTAPLQVLQAVFDPLAIGATDHTTLANAIITRRATTPFSSMISSNPSDTASSFARFVDTQTAYLTTAAERNAVKENCDASLYNTTQTTSWTTGNSTTTEFCYYSTAYSVTARGKVVYSYRQAKRVFEDDGTFNITSGSLTLNYWREVIP